jgi:hypothetical protein
LDVRSLVECRRIFPTHRKIIIGADRMAYAEHSGQHSYSEPIRSIFTLPSRQIIYLALGLLMFALVYTFIARRCPQGPQPAAYGHLQTLANLVDEWSPTMWWGHKADREIIYHAGESLESFLC